jgi:hypothetical protein
VPYPRPRTVAAGYHWTDFYAIQVGADQHLNYRAALLPMAETNFVLLVVGTAIAATIKYLYCLSTGGLSQGVPRPI